MVGQGKICPQKPIVWVVPHLVIYLGTLQLIGERGVNSLCVCILERGLYTLIDEEMPSVFVEIVAPIDAPEKDLGEGLPGS